MNLTDSLPENVILEIFKFLSLPERKNARLVCKRWYRVCNRRSLAENEAFLISNVYKIRTVVEVLVKCKRKMLNLKFEQRFFDQSSNILWSRCGYRIQSLEFNTCKFSEDIIKRIFVKCKNLNEFSSNGGSIKGCDPYHEILPRTKSILQIGDDIVRPKLRILQLKSHNLAFRECDLHLISSAFPQLKNLNIMLFLSEDKDARDIPNVTVLVNLLNNGLKNLEKLYLDFMLSFELEPTTFSTVPQFNCNRLKDVSMSLAPFILAGYSLNKILHYKFWTSFSISSCMPYGRHDMNNIARLINENPLLEKLDVHFTLPTDYQFCNLFVALVKSRLKSLKIEMADYRYSLEQAKLFISAVNLALHGFIGLPCNNTVEYLSFHSNTSAEFGDLFLQYFQNVQDLSISPGKMNTIFKYQKNLKRLQIHYLLVIPNDEPPVCRSIESLELIDIKPLKLDLFTTYQFPSLKYLITQESSYSCVYNGTMRKFEREYSIGPADLNINEETGNGMANYVKSKEEFVQKINKLMLSLFRKSPHLEGIEFGSDYLLDMEALTIFFQSCLGFHQLRYVSVDCSSKIDKWVLKREVEKFFKKCPSFRGLWFSNLKFCFSFYFNIVTKKYEFGNEFYEDTSRDYYYFYHYMHDFWHYKP